MDEVHLLLDVLSPKGGHITSAHAPLAILDGKGAGNVVPMGTQEEEKMSLVTSDLALLQQVRATTRSRGWCVGRRGKVAKILLEFLQHGRGPALVRKLEELGSILVHWLLVGREGHLWVHPQGPWKYSSQGQWETGLSSLREQAVRR